MSRHILLPLLSLLLVLQRTQIQAVTTCTTTAQSTFYDGYLDTGIYSGQFDATQNSFFKFGNPFQGLTSLSAATVAFWAKIPLLSSNGSAQSGTILDCTDSAKIRSSNGNVSYYVLQPSNGQSATITYSYANNTSNWNHFAFSFAASTLTIYLNGISAISFKFTATSIGSNSATCTLGNSQALTDPLTFQIRHILFQKQGWTATTKISTIMHNIILPTDATTLAYFEFQRNFQFNAETYFTNSTRQFNSSGVSIVTSSEPEFVCYCTGTYPNFLEISQNFTLYPFNLTQISANLIDTNGFIIDALVYAHPPSQYQTASSDILLFNMSGYAYLYLTNSTNTLRVDVFKTTDTTTPTQSYSFKTFRFRFNYWTLISINLSKTSAILAIDGLQVEKQTATITFQKTSNQFYIQPVNSQTQLSYLLNYINLRTSANKTIFNYTMSQNQFSLNYTTCTKQGLPQFQSNSKFCSSAELVAQNYWNGYSCTERRLVPQFTNSSGQLKSQLMSSKSNMTIEIWMKDTFTSTSIQNQVIFENSLDGIAPLVQIGILTGSTQTASRQIFCIPNVISNTMASLTVTTQGIWNHFSCISNNVNNSLTAVMYNFNTQQTVFNSIPNAAFSDIASSKLLITSLGRKVDATLPFVGMLRDLRIWSTPLSMLQIQINRFQATKDSVNMLHYFMLSDQLNPTSIKSTTLPQFAFVEQQFNSTEVSYQADTTLTICQDGYVYNGNCCQLYNLSTTTFSITQNNYTSKNLITVKIDSVGSDYIYSYLHADFTLISVGYNYNTTTFGTVMNQQTYLSQYFTKTKTQSFSVSADLINPLAYSFTIQAFIYSDLDPSQNLTLNSTFVLTCPAIFVSTHPIIGSNENTQIVSLNSTDTSPRLYTTNYMQCYTPKTGVITTNTINTLSYSFNNTSVKFASLFTQSTDKTVSYSIANKLSVVKTFTNLNLTAQLMKTATVRYDYNYILLSYQNITLSMGSVAVSQFQKLLQGELIVVDLTSMSVNGNTSTSLLRYDMICPENLFSSAADYNTLCQIPQTGLLSMASTKLNVIANVNYTFTLYITVVGTSIYQNVTLTLQFYKDGGTTNCPRVQLSSKYTYDIYNPTTLQIMSDPYLYCSGTFYTINSYQWSLLDSLDSTKNMTTTLLSFGTQTVLNYANITSTNITKVLPGQVLNLSLTMTATASSQSSASIFTSVATSQVTFTQIQLSVNIVAQNYNKQQINSQQISFLEEKVAMNASTSFDPDNTTSLLTYLWTCPSIVNQYYICQGLASADSKVLSLNALQRAKIGFSYNTVYNFSVTATSTVNPYKQAITYTLSVVFASPTSNDYKLNGLASSCDQFQITSPLMYSVNSTYPRVIKYDIANYTNVFANITANSSFTCKNGSVNEQAMFMYIQNFKEFSLNQPIQYILEQNFTYGNLQQNFTTNFNFTNNFNMQYSNYDFMQVQVYWFTQRFTTLDYTFLATDYFYLYRTKAPLVAALNTDSVSVDKFDSFQLNAGNSVDLEGLNLNYTYFWTCPNSVAVCAVTTGPILTVSPDSRYLGNANSNGQTYKYSVIMTDGSRNSSAVSTSVTITMKSSYASCLSLTLQTTHLNSYSSSNNNTLVIEYNQSVPIYLEYSVTNASNCPGNVTIQKSYFTPQDTSEGQFWFQQTSTSIEIQQNILSSITNYAKYPGTLSTIIFTQFFNIGLDTATQLSSSSYINVNLTQPPLVWNVNANRITTFDSTTKTITLSASQSYEPVLFKQLSFQWSCPSYFSDVCQSSSLATNILTLAETDSMSSYYNTSHEFTLTIISFDQTRSTTKSFFMYISDPSNGPFVTSTQYSQCGIYELNSTQSILSIQKTQIFQFSCPTSNLESQLVGTDTLQWSIDGLTINQDYYVVNNQLYLKPLRFQKLTTRQLIVSVTIPSLSSNPFKQAFDYANNQMMLNGQITFNPADQYTSLSQDYQLVLTNIQSLYNYGIQVQLRGSLTQYNSKQIILPVMPLNSYTQALFFDKLSLHQTSRLYLDVFDMSYNYMSSFNLTMPQLNYANFTQELFESKLQSIVGKTSSDYSNTTLSQYDYILNMDTIQQLSEAILANKITISADQLTSAYQGYALQILSYLKQTYPTVITYFYIAGNHTKTVQQRITLDRKVIFIIQNCIQTSVNYTSALSDIVSILQQIKSDFALMTQYGDDYQVLRQYLITILSTSYAQASLLPAVIQDEEANTIKNDQISTIQSQINALQVWIIGQDFSDTVGQLQYTNTGQTSKGTLRIDSANTTGITLQNQLVSTEQVYLSNQEKLTEYQVSYFEVSYNLQDNATSPASSQIYINAYDQYYQIKDVYFSQTLSKTNSLIQFFKQKQLLTDVTTSGVVYITMQASQQYKDLFQQKLSDNSSKTYYAPRCVYFDEDHQAWSDYGIQNVSYDGETGIINCSTSHLSLFTMDYLELGKPGSIGGNDTNTTSTSVFNSGEVPIYVYYLAVAVPSFITLLTIGLSFLSHTEWQGGDPKVEKLKRKTYSCFGIFCATCGLHHILFSALCGRQKANVHLTIPKYFKMIDFWWLFYSIFAGLGLAFYFTSGKSKGFWYDMYNREQLDVSWEQNKYLDLVYLGLFTLGVILVGRFFILSLGYLFYFCNKKMSKTNMKSKDDFNDDDALFGLNSDRKDQDTDRGTDLEDNLLNRKPKAKKGKKKKKKKSRSKQLREEHNFEMEGGSSDEEVQKYKQAVRRQHKSRSGNSQQRQQSNERSSYNAYANNKRGSNEQDQDANMVKKSNKSGNRYDQYEQKEYSANRISKQKNMADMIDQMEDPSSQPNSATRVKKSQNRYKVNESNVKASGTTTISSTNRTKKYERRQDSPEVFRNQKNSNNDSMENQKKSGNRDYNEEEEVQDRQTFGKKKGGNSKERTKNTDRQKQSNNDKQNLFMPDSNYNQQSKGNKTDDSWRNSKGNTISTIYKPHKKYTDDTVEEEYKEKSIKTNIKRKRDQSPALEHNRTISTSSSKQPQHTQYRINQSTKINSSIDSYQEMDDRSTEKKGKKSNKLNFNKNDFDLDERDSFDDIAQYKMAQIILTVLKLIFMMGCMALTFWTMWLFTDWTHLYYWLIVAGCVLGALIIVIEPLFIMIFSLFFKVTSGNGTCIRIAGLFLIGNGHRNVINGILFELNNKE